MGCLYCKYKYIFSAGFLASNAVEVTPSINPAVAGGTVTLSLSPSMNLKSGSWALGGTLVLTWLGDQQAVFPSHSGRASVNSTTGALTLGPLKLTDSGVYILQSNDPVLTANASVTVIGETSQKIFKSGFQMVHLLSTNLSKC